jgi:ATP-dependent Clp protease adaptor protein ClpS
MESRLSKLTIVNSGENTHKDNDLAVKESSPKLKRPPMYQVILLNDDFTPMEFVVHVLEKFFRMDREKATRIMFRVHTQGKGLCGTYVREIAETKVAQVNEYSRSNNHPLLCTMETV